MNQQIFETTKYNMMPWSTPKMSSNSQNGYTVTQGDWQMFNPDITYLLNYHWDTGTLVLPARVCINKVFIGVCQINGYYVARSAYDSFYLDDQLVHQIHFDPLAQNGTYISIPNIVCNKIVNHDPTGSAWRAEDSGGGANAQPGKQYFGFATFP